MAPAMKNTRKRCFFLLCFYEQKADEAKKVLDKANVCPKPATWEFLFAFATASLYDLVFTCQR